MDQRVQLAMAANRGRWKLQCLNDRIWLPGSNWTRRRQGRARSASQQAREVFLTVEEAGWELFAEAKEADEEEEDQEWDEQRLIGPQREFHFIEYNNPGVAKAAPVALEDDSG